MYCGYSSAMPGVGVALNGGVMFSLRRDVRNFDVGNWGDDPHADHPLKPIAYPKCATFPRCVFVSTSL